MNRRNLLTGSLGAWLAAPGLSAFARGFVAECAADDETGGAPKSLGGIGPDRLAGSVSGLPDDGILATVDGKGLATRDVLAPLFLQNPEAIFSALEQTIRRELVRREATRLGVYVNQKVLAESTDEFIKKQTDAYNMKFGDADFTKYMEEKYGVTPKAYRAILEDVALENLLYERVVRYTSRQVERLQIRWIVVDKLQRAKDLLEKLKEGASFAALAKSESKDATSSKNGGLLPALPSTAVDNVVIKVAATLKEGELSGIGTESNGSATIYWIAKLEKRFPAVGQDYAACADALDEELRQTRLELIEELVWDEEVRTRHKIEVRLGRA